jgi:hypothetical protein
MQLFIVLTFLFVYSATHTILVYHKLYDSLTSTCHIYHDDYYFRWMYTLKCVSLALSVESRRDRVIINQMESLANMFRMEFQNDMNAVNTDLKYSKQYRITKYFVKDLENVPLKYRYVITR